MRPWLALAIALSLLAPRAGAVRLSAGQRSIASVDAELEKGRQLLQAHDYFNALKQYQRANALAGGKSADAFLGMALAARGMKVYPNALDYAQSAAALAGGNARLIARARKLRGEVYDAMGDQTACETELRAALQADPDSHVPDLHYELALALLRQHRDEEGLAELRKEIELRPIGTTADEARALIANPRRGRERYAPDFEIESADGQRITLESLRGRVVLIDFWVGAAQGDAHFQAPLLKLLKAHAGAPLTVISVNEEGDAEAWRAFVQKHPAPWPQVWDHRQDLRRLFDVETLPAYVLMDGEGIERMRLDGARLDDTKALASEIDRQITRLSTQPRP